jgi:hypothetical protein
MHTTYSVLKSLIFLLSSKIVTEDRIATENCIRKPTRKLVLRLIFYSRSIKIICRRARMAAFSVSSFLCEIYKITFAVIAKANTMALLPISRKKPLLLRITVLNNECCEDGQGCLSLNSYRPARVPDPNFIVVSINM